MKKGALGLVDMKKGPWQTRVRSCRQVTSPEGKEARVRKPYKKPRQVIVKETQEVDSEAPTQLGETVDTSSRGEVSEFYVETETTLEQPNVIAPANVPLQKSPASLKAVSESSDEEDNIPISQTIRKKANVIPVTIRMLNYREACETADFGEVQRWSEDDGDEIVRILVVSSINLII
jgi:hypothetical protein